MYKKSDSLIAYSASLMEDALTEPSLGLSGKLGIAIYLLEYARWSCQENFRVMGEQLVSDVLERTSLDTCGFSYHTGVLGIGVGIAYLHNRGFITGEPDEALAEIDELARQAINFRSLEETQLSTDLLGLLFYLYLRTVFRKERSLPVLKNKESLIYAIDWLSESKLSNDRVYAILCLLHKSKTYPTKTEALLKGELNRIGQSHRLRVYSEMDLLDIPPLSVLQPWF